MNDNTFSLALRTHVMKLCRLTHKMHLTNARQTKISLNMFLYFPTYLYTSFSTLMVPLINRASARYIKFHLLCHALFWFYWWLMLIWENCIQIRGEYRNMFRDIFVCLVLVKYILCVSLHSFMTCVRSAKEKVLSFISYYIIYFNPSPINFAQIFSLTDHSLPDC